MEFNTQDSGGEHAQKSRGQRHQRDTDRGPRRPKFSHRQKPSVRYKNRGSNRPQRTRSDYNKAGRNTVPFDRKSSEDYANHKGGNYSDHAKDYGARSRDPMGFKNQDRRNTRDYSPRSHGDRRDARGNRRDFKEHRKDVRHQGNRSGAGNYDNHGDPKDCNNRSDWKNRNNRSDWKDRDGRGGWRGQHDRRDTGSHRRSISRRSSTPSSQSDRDTKTPTRNLHTQGRYSAPIIDTTHGHSILSTSISTQRQPEVQKVLKLRAEGASSTHTLAKLKQLKEVVREPGFALVNAFEKIKNSQYNGPQSHFADRAYQRSMESLCAAIESAFVDFSIVTPEAQSTGIKKEIYVDGLVGWGNFVRGRYGWGVLVGTYFDGVCETCVLYDPLTSETYSAALGNGLFINQRRIQPARAPARHTISDTYNIGCRALTIASVATGSTSAAEIATHSEASWKPTLLLVTEARGLHKVLDGKVTVTGYGG